MAILETIDHQPMVFDPAAKSADYGFVPNNKRKLEASFPQIFFSNGEPWHEANRYAFHRYYDLQKDIKTIHSGMSHLTRYAKWLEANNLHWLHFPKRKSERCLFQFRGHLIELRDNGLLAPSTASQVMNSVVAFYRWAAANNYAESSSRFFDSKVVKLSFLDSVGFRRTMGVVSSELAIPNRKRKGLQLEDGLVPISQASANKFLTFLAKHRNRELYLMSKVALQTGCRHETITTLNIDVLKNAYPDYKLSNILRVKVGPGTGVNTKFDVSGEIYFPSSLVSELIDYFNSAEAILRRSRANKALSKCVFITSRGNSYTRQTFGTLLYRLKDELIKAGHSEFGRFKFHQLRATFGTMLMRALMRTEGMSSLNAIEFVRDAMLHKDASVTWKYIKFIEREPIESQFLDTLWAIFTGSRDASNEMIRHLTSGEVTREN